MTISSPPLVHEPLETASSRRDQATNGRSLFTPSIDFLCLGGGSLLLFVPMMFLDVETFEPMVAATVLFIAHFVNSPHFAHSYQIFYRNFRQKAFGNTYSAQLRARYIIAGIVAPAALIGFFFAAAVFGNGRILGFGLNIMLFLVGWHYVKQGYGMIIVDAVLKKSFFPDTDKRILIVNAYTCWLLGWSFFTTAVAERDMYGLAAYSFALPQFVLIAMAIAASVTSALALVVIYRRWASGDSFPFNGTVAYLVTIYLWIVLPSVVAPAAFVVLMALAVPAAHSVQYLAVVWRYQLNVEKDGQRPERKYSLFNKPVARLIYFFIFGVVISFAGFWIIPTVLDLFATYDRAVFGSQMFLFMFAIFINVHHYFLDNVMWRRENPDVAKYLFS